MSLEHWTRRARLEAGAALLLTVAAAWLGYDGVRQRLRARAAREAFVASDKGRGYEAPAYAIALRVAADDPDRLELQALLAALEVRGGRLKEANGRYRALADLEREDVRALGHLGLAAVALGRAVAVDAATRDSADSSGSAGGARASQGAPRALDPDEISFIESRARRADRGDRRPAARAVLGALALARGDAAGAKAALESAIRAEGRPGRRTLLAAYSNLAAAASRLGDHRAAADAAAAAVILSGGSERRVERYARELAAGVLAARGEAVGDAARSAVEAVRPVTRAGDRPYRMGRREAALVLMAVGIAEAQRGELDEAVKRLNAALKRAPAVADDRVPPVATSVRRNLGVVHLRRIGRATSGTARRKEARRAASMLAEAASEVRERDPALSLELLRAAGHAFRVAEFFGDAEKTLRKRWDRLPGDRRTALELALTYETWGRRGRPADAITWYQNALKADPAAEDASAIRLRIKKLELRRR